MVAEEEWHDNKELLRRNRISYSGKTEFETLKNEWRGIPEWSKNVKDTMSSINGCDLLLGKGRFDTNMFDVNRSEVNQMALVYYYKLKKSLSESVWELVDDEDMGVNPLAHRFAEIQTIYASESHMDRRRRTTILERVRDHKLTDAGDMVGVLQALVQLVKEVVGLNQDEITTRNVMVALETFLQEGLFDLPTDQHAAVSLIKDALRDVKVKEPDTMGEMKKLLTKFIRRLCEVMPSKFEVTAGSADKRARKLFGMLHSPDNLDLKQAGGIKAPVMAVTNNAGGGEGIYMLRLWGCIQVLWMW